MRVLRYVSLGLIGLVFCAAAGTGITFWHNGYRMYVVHTGSMIPNYVPGDVVIDKPVQHLVPGEVITFRHSHISTDVVTHRITKVQNGLIYTKGDANPTPDAWAIDPDQVQGTVVTSVPDLGYAIVFLQQRAGDAAVMAAAISLILLWELFFAAGRREATDEAPRARGAHRGSSMRHGALKATGVTAPTT